MALSNGSFATFLIVGRMFATHEAQGDARPIEKVDRP
jgi:hypothetical protein